MKAPERTLVIKVKFRYRFLVRGAARAQQKAWEKVEGTIRQELARQEVCINLEEITTERWDLPDQSPIIEGEVYCFTHGSVHDDTCDPFMMGPDEEGNYECSKADHRQIAWVPIEGDDLLEMK